MFLFHGMVGMAFQEFISIFLHGKEFRVVRHVTGTGSGLLGGILRVVVQMSALTLKGPL